LPTQFASSNLLVYVIANFGNGLHALHVSIANNTFPVKIRL